MELIVWEAVTEVNDTEFILRVTYPPNEEMNMSVFTEDYIKHDLKERLIRALYEKLDVRIRSWRE